MMEKTSARLTSLLLVEERLLEAEYFAAKLFVITDSTNFGYELNAFLAAARSVTFLLQKEMSRVEGFQIWWKTEQEMLRRDESARFFLGLRNYSQKEGRVSVVGSRVAGGKWRYMFAGTADPVPTNLLNRDVGDCCLEHLAKLASAILRFANAFPYHSCPARALTTEGVLALGLDLDRLEESVGIPLEFSAVRPPMPIEARLRLLSRYVDSVDFEAIDRIANYAPKPPLSREHDDIGFGISLVEQIELARSAQAPRHHAARLALTTEFLRSEVKK
jgi:hypothetical protein